MSPERRPIEDVVLVCDTETDDGSGGKTRTPVDMATTWMELWPVSGRELLRAGVADAVEIYRGRIRYRDDLTRTWRIRRVRDSKVFEITAPPREVDRGRWLELDLAGR